MRIAEVARRSGIPPATLRYYEQIDLLPAPPRSPAGYRDYEEPVLDRLAFIARAKGLGCSLSEIAALMPAWEGGRCGPVQHSLRKVASAKLSETADRMADLQRFAGDLVRLLAAPAGTDPHGPCDQGCGCLTDAAPAPVACTLDAVDLAGRRDDWRAMLTHVVDRRPVDGGVRLQLGPGAPLDRLAQLVQAERGCCGFFAFAITVDDRGTGLEVRAPADGQRALAALFGLAV